MVSNVPTDTRKGDGFIPSPTYEVPLPPRTARGQSKYMKSVIFLRLLVEEKVRVEEVARLLGLSLQEVARGAVLGFCEKVLEDDIKLITESTEDYQGEMKDE